MFLVDYQSLFPNQISLACLVLKWGSSLCRINMILFVFHRLTKCKIPEEGIYELAISLRVSHSLKTLR